MRNDKAMVILITATVFLTSLAGWGYTKIFPVKSHAVEVTYWNGDRETMILRTRHTRHIQLQEGELRVSGSGVYASGVRRYKILPSQTAVQLSLVE